jgi:hypothetical protein
MPRNHPDIPFERDADDAVCHGQTEAQAQSLRQELEQRFAQCRLELHPPKTKLVYGKDDRQGNYLNERFDVLGDTCRARRSKNRWGTYFVHVSPAASAEATCDCRRALRRWHLHTRSDTSLEDLSRMLNPVLRGGSPTTAGSTSRPSIRRSSTWRGYWSDGRCGSTSVCGEHGATAGRRCTTGRVRPGRQGAGETAASPRPRGAGGHPAEAAPDDRRRPVRR